MAIEIQTKTNISGASVAINSVSITRSGSGAIGISEDLPSAQAGQLTTRTDENTGTITMASGSHTIATGNVVDIYWSGGVQYGVTVGTVSTTSVPIDSGTGDNLPPNDSQITIVPQLLVNVNIDGDNVKFIAMILEATDKRTPVAGHVQFIDSESSEIAEVDLTSGTPKVWDIEGGDTNAFTGNVITTAKVSTGGEDASGGYMFKIVGVQDATP